MLELLDDYDYESDSDSEFEPGELCHECKRYLLFKFKSNTKTCYNCHSTIFVAEEIKKINFNNKLK
jgi:hypothetical protein